MKIVYQHVFTLRSTSAQITRLAQYHLNRLLNGLASVRIETL
jgi:hypothetical protein